MRPFIIGIGGGHSGVGKTTIASKILKNLKGWGAIKYTKTTLYSSIIDDIRILSEEGKDTKRLLDSGAEKVLWVQSPFSELGEILPIAVEMLSHLKGIVVEGNSAIDVLKPDVVIFISGSEKKFKSGADKILGMADIVISEEDIPKGKAEGAKRFHKDDVEGYIDYLIRLIKKYQDDRIFRHPK